MNNQQKLQNLLIKATVIGLMMVFVGHIISSLFKKNNKSSLPDECKNWNKNYIMEKSLFATGFVVSILYDQINLNNMTNLTLATNL